MKALIVIALAILWGGIVLATWPEDRTPVENAAYRCVEAEPGRPPESLEGRLARCRQLAEMNCLVQHGGAECLR